MTYEKLQSRGLVVRGRPASWPTITKIGVSVEEAEQLIEIEKNSQEPRKHLIDRLIGFILKTKKEEMRQ